MLITDRQDPLAQLTSLRFFAALLVLLSHLLFLERSASPALSNLYDLVFRQGACGVTFFFILSGFILSHAYGPALGTGRISVTTYLTRRAARIYPLHLIVGVVFLGYLAWHADLPPGRAIVLNLALLQSWFPDPLVHYSLNGPSWSLSDELFFYLLFPWLLKVKPRTLLRFCVAGLLVILTGASVAAMQVPSYSPLIDWLFYAFPVTRLFEFITGILLHLAWRSGVGRSFTNSGAEIGLVMLVLSVMVAVQIFTVPLVFRYQLAFLPPMAALIWVFAHGRGVLSRLLRHPTLQRLGEASFALYLIHRPMVSFMERWAGVSVMRDVALALAMMALALFASVLIFALIDRPLQQWLRRRERRAMTAEPLAIRP